MSDIIKNINALETLQETVKNNDLAPKKSLGQNFLFDMNITLKIARIAGNLDKGSVIEIGPGPGGLTRALLLNGANLTAIETDPRAINALKQLQLASYNKLEIISRDANKIDITKIGIMPRQVVANLPYNIGTLLLTNWLKTPKMFSKFTLMFQKEVAQRITATVGNKHYGRLAILCNWSCFTQVEIYLNPSTFTPPPKVDSAVISLIPRPNPLFPANAESLSNITKSSFGQRRKMIRSSLKSLGVDVPTLLEKTGIDGTKRAEELTIEQFCLLSNAFDELKP